MTKAIRIFVICLLISSMLLASARRSLRKEVLQADIPLNETKKNTTNTTIASNLTEESNATNRTLHIMLLCPGAPNPNPDGP